MKQYVKDLDNALDLQTLQDFLSWMVENVELCGDMDATGKRVIDALIVYSQQKKEDQQEQQLLTKAYRDGWKEGQKWTQERLIEHGWSSASACLQSEEKEVEKLLSYLKGDDSFRAEDQRQYLYGVLAGTRDKLGKIEIEQGSIKCKR